MEQYDNLSKESLVKLIRKHEENLKLKYGLFWDNEKEPEQVVLDCRDNLPILKRVKGKEIKEPKNNTQEDNILIEGDNYHALTVLNYTHQEEVDVIYIDPPYNTENEGFIYNDKKVDLNDGYRHSKWLNFMEKRLKLAKDILSPKGSIFISIDDNELYNLKLVCDKIFNPQNFIANLIVISAPAGTQSSINISQQHNYCLFYSKSNKFNINKTLLLEEELKLKYNKEDEMGDYYLERLWKRGVGGKKEDVPTLHFPVYYNLKEGTIHFEDEIKENVNLIKIIPFQTKGVLGRWTWSLKKMKNEREKLIVKKVSGEYKLFKKKYSNEDLGTLPNSIINSSIGRTEIGSLELKTILGKKSFDYPKSSLFIKHLLKMVSKKDSLVLDFFAGSGTTAQAVLDLNKEDSGSRKFILCTNNENNICTKITYPRIEKVIKGYEFEGKDKTILFEKKITWTDLSKKMEVILKEISEIIEQNKDSYDEIKKEFNINVLKVVGVKSVDDKKEGFGGNLQYFKTSLLQTTKNRDQNKINLTQKCSEMLCLKENIFNVKEEEEDYRIFSSNNNQKFLCIYFNFIDEGFDNFLEKLKKLNGKKKIYIFSLEDKIDYSLFEGVSDYTLETIPEKILEIYKKLAKMNISIRVETIFIDLEKAKKQIFKDKDKDTGAKTLRVVLEKVVQKIAQKNQINILTDKGKEIKLSTLNDILKADNVFSKLEWEENKIYSTIGNYASHGDYDEFDLTQIDKFYKHVQMLINKFNI